MLINAKEARRRLEEARNDFVEGQMKKIEEEINAQLKVNCDSYRQTGKAAEGGMAIKVALSELCPENRQLLEEAGYIIEEDTSINDGKVSDIGWIKCHP